MINFKNSKKAWGKNKFNEGDIYLQEYKKHFQLALINLEQNSIEERMPEFRRIA
jgi:hypothetical protein